MLNAFLTFAAQSRPPLKLDSFVKARMNIPSLVGKVDFLKMKLHVEKELMGHSIMGSTDGKHFVNLSVSPTGSRPAVAGQNRRSPNPHNSISLLFNHIQIKSRLPVHPIR